MELSITTKCGGESNTFNSLTLNNGILAYLLVYRTFTASPIFTFSSQLFQISLSIPYPTFLFFLGGHDCNTTNSFW